MKIHVQSFALAAVLLGALANPALARTRSSCTYGVDCLCDQLKSDPAVVWCEDYENPGYTDGGTTWTKVYNANAVNQCWENGVGSRIAVGTATSACLNIVKEGSCDVPGEGDCVFDGNQSIGNKMDAGITHGIYGFGKFSRGVRTFGITSVVKFSSNYLRGPGPGFKYMEWNNGKQSLHGGQDACAGGSGHLTSEVPGQKGDVCGAYSNFTSIWDGKLFYFPNPLPTSNFSATLGSIWDDGATLYFRPFKAHFENGQMNWPQGTWACLKTKLTNYGTNSTRIEQWFQGPYDNGPESKVIDISGINTSNLSDENGAAATGQTSNDYFNGPQCNGQDCGYGTSGCPCALLSPVPPRAYRYEDNFVVREGDPVMCADIGFGSNGGASSSQPPPTSQPPVAPFLDQ